MIPGGLNLGCMGNRILASDDFSETDNTVIAGKLLDTGGTWQLFRQIVSGVASVISNKAQLTNADNAATAFYSSENSARDIIISARLTTNAIASAASVGLVALHNGVVNVDGSAGTYIYADIRTNTSLRIIKSINGVRSVLVEDTTKNGGAPNTAYNCTLTIAGNVVTFVTPFGTIGTILTDSYSSNKVGFLLGRATTERSGLVANFKVESL